MFDFFKKRWSQIVFVTVAIIFIVIMAPSLKPDQPAQISQVTLAAVLPSSVDTESLSPMGKAIFTPIEVVFPAYAKHCAPAGGPTYSLAEITPEAEECADRARAVYCASKAEGGFVTKADAELCNSQ